MKYFSAQLYTQIIPFKIEYTYNLMGRFAYTSAGEGSFFNKNGANYYDRGKVWCHVTSSLFVLNNRVRVNIVCKCFYPYLEGFHFLCCAGLFLQRQDEMQ